MSDQDTHDETSAPLAWEPEAEPDASCPYDHTSAATPFGTYRIEWKSWKDYPSFGVDFEGHHVTTAGELDDAKKAAQVDFNKRLRACYRGVAVEGAPIGAGAVTTGAEPVKTPGDALGAVDLLRIELRQTMLDTWNSICADTDCHPLDIQHQGRKLYFSPAHWADATASELASRLSNHATFAPALAALPAAKAVGDDKRAELPLAVRLRDEEGPPLPQMIAQRRAQLAERPSGDVRAAVIEECAKIADQVAVNAERRAAGHLPQSAAQEAAYNKMEGAQQAAQQIRERASSFSSTDK